MSVPAHFIVASQQLKQSRENGGQITYTCSAIWADRPSRHAKRRLIPALAPVSTGMPLDEGSTYAVPATAHFASANIGNVSAEQMNYYSFHIGDYAVHTRHLSLLEDLAYRRCLDLYYTREQALPSDHQQVARLIGMREHATDVLAILVEFFTVDSCGDWAHSRCDDEIAKVNAKADIAKVNGRLGGRPPKAKQETQTEPSRNPAETQSVIFANPEITGSQATQDPRPKTQDPRPKAEASPPPPGFARFWGVWPASSRKGARGECEKLWVKTRCELSIDSIEAHVLAMTASEGWRKQGGEFIPSPLVYIRQRRWEGATEAPGCLSSAFEGAI